MNHQRNASKEVFGRVYDGLQTFIMSRKEMMIGDTVTLSEVDDNHTRLNPSLTGRTYTFWVGHVHSLDDGRFVVSITEVE